MDDFKLITAILPDKNGKELMIMLEENGIITVNKQTARGNSLISGHNIEVDILTLVVDEKDSNSIFRLMYDSMRIDEHHHGIIYQTSLKNSSKYSLPVLKDKE